MRRSALGAGGVVLVAVAAGLVYVGQRGPSTPVAALPPTAEQAVQQVVQSKARPLLVAPAEPEAARSLSTLRRIDEHPLYAMSYYGPAPRVDDSVVVPPTSAHALGTAGRRPFACTLFFAAGDPARPLFGRNFDWDANPALVLFANPTDAYRSVSVVDISYLGIHGDDATDPGKRDALLRAVTMPFDGMNEHGLAVGMAAVDEARAELAPGRPAVGSVGIMRMVLDRARTVDEAVKIFGSYNVDFDSGPGLHYMVVDATGRSAVVEFVDGRLTVVPKAADERWQVMENFHLATTVESDRAAFQRYSTAAGRLAELAGGPTVDRAMGLLAEVAQGHTQWSTVYDVRDRSVSIVTGRNFEMVHSFNL